MVYCYALFFYNFFANKLDSIVEVDEFLWNDIVVLFFDHIGLDCINYIIFVVGFL